MKVFVSTALWRISGPKRDEMHKEQFHNLLLAIYYYDNEIGEDKIGGECSAHENKKCVQEF